MTSKFIRTARHQYEERCDDADRLNMAGAAVNIVNRQPSHDFAMRVLIYKRLKRWRVAYRQVLFYVALLALRQDAGFPAGGFVQSADVALHLVNCTRQTDKGYAAYERKRKSLVKPEHPGVCLSTTNARTYECFLSEVPKNTED